MGKKKKRKMSKAEKFSMVATAIGAILAGIAEIIVAVYTVLKD